MFTLWYLGIKYRNGSLSSAPFLLIYFIDEIVESWDGLYKTSIDLYDMLWISCCIGDLFLYEIICANLSIDVHVNMV